MSQSPRQIDYATPNPRRGWSAWKILLVTAMVLIGVLILAVAWWGIASPVAVSKVTITVTPPTPAPATPTPIVLSSDPMVIDLRQRGGLQLPGGPGTPYLWLGDITGGRVLVTVTDDNHSWVVSRSMQEGATINFAHAGTTYYLTLKKLTNRITKDEASLELSTTKPPTTQKAGN